MSVLGMTASAASAHKHEFSASKDANMHEDQHLFSHPLLFLQGKLQAWTSVYTSVAPTANVSTRLPLQPSDEPHSTSILNEPAEHGEHASSTEDDAYVSKSSPKTSVARAPATKTSYVLSHPAPGVRPQLIRHRNRMLLQFRKVSHIQSPVPAMEVFPGSAFPKSMSRRLSQTPRNHQALSSSDLLVVNCQSYAQAGQLEDGSRNSGTESDPAIRGIVGSIHCGGNITSLSDVVINIGSSRWAASGFEKGRYEFQSTDDDGNAIIARWWVKHSHRNSTLGGSAADRSSANSRKFNFSVLRPGSRKHPIIGRMDHASLQIMDSYVVPDSLPSSPLVSPSEGFSPLSLGYGASKTYFNTTYPASNTPIETSEDLRKLMMVTSIWVIVSEGWSDALTSHFDARNATANCHPNTKLRSVHNKTHSSDSRVDIIHGTHSDTRRRIPSWPSRQSLTAQTPESPRHPHLSPRRSHTISAFPRSMRKKSFMSFRSAEDPSSVEGCVDSFVDHTPQDSTDIRHDDISTPTKSEDNITGITMHKNFDTGVPSEKQGETTWGLMGMVRRSKSKSEPTRRRSKLIDMVRFRHEG